ncbi:MAG: hypothetical protein HC845_08880 [Akkermansiaceae bacterium]|nr:hypothetical protein [Akkermansiaceae bacterium]
MARQLLRYILFVALVFSSLFASWVWFRPYSWSSDAAARCKVQSTLVTRDESYYWVDVHLKVNTGVNHDLQKPVLLETGSGAKLEPAETTFAGADMTKSREIWFRFWLEAPQIEGPLNLHLNDGTLSIKSGQGAPKNQKPQISKFHH